MSYGRIVFGASAVLFGAILLLWHDADTWQQLVLILRLPFGMILGDCLALAQIIGGMGLLFPQSARASSIGLMVVYALFSLASVPPIIGDPATYQEYGSFFEQFALLCGALGAYAASGTMAEAAGLARLARAGIGVCALSFALDQAFYLRETARLVPPWIPPSQIFWAGLTTVAFALAALAIITNLQARLALRLMTLMLALFGVLVWLPRLVAHPSSHGDWSEFTLTVIITGAAWVVGDVLGEERALFLKGT